jgi:hypothetical protein
MPWTREEIDNRLRLIMKNIHTTCMHVSERFGTPGNYVNGANIAGFLKVADAMIDQGDYLKLLTCLAGKQDSILIVILILICVAASFTISEQ